MMKGTHHLLSKHTRRLDTKLATAHIKQVFKTWSKKIDDQDIVQSFLTKMVYLWYTSCPGPEKKCQKHREDK